MDVTQPDGHFSPRQFATVVGLSEGSIRLALREHRISAMTGDFGRRWIPESEITKRFALQLTNPITQGATLATLRRNARVAQVALSPDDELIRNAQLFLSAAIDEPTPTSASVESWTPVERQWGLAGTDAD
jgi:hypothetical protein